MTESQPPISSPAEAEPSAVSARALARERAARKEAERLLEEKSTQLFEARAALLRVNEELEARVAQRTAELSVALEQATAASRAKSEFSPVCRMKSARRSTA